MDAEVNEWQPIETAPRDGTEVDLCWFDDDKSVPEEIYTNMRWNQFATNKLVQTTKGIWAAHHLQTNELLFTWSSNGGNGPTHWRECK